jgi:hypothetical protein
MARERETTILSPIVDGWLKRISEAHRAKSGFNAVAAQCDQFFNADLGFMWDSDFQRKYMGGAVAPKFKVTIAKAFELVAVIGPALYWRYPDRVIKNYPKIDLFPELFGTPDDQQAMQLFERALAEQQAEENVAATRNSLMQRYLNYSQREQPGGLSLHSELAITEALVKGRGCTWVENYKFADSKRNLTGCFYDSVDNLFVDPDCIDPTLNDAKWIARKHVNPWWELEDKFGLDRGSLKDRGTIESAESQATRSSADDAMYRQAGKTFDLVVWYEVWSKGGVGTRMKDVTSSLDQAFDDVVGDYAYMAVAKGIEFPLNCPIKKFVNADDEQVKKMFAWPTPFYKDSRWPVALLDFYRKPNSCWPLALLSTGLGELMFLNVMMSVMCDRAYETSRNIVAYFRSAADQVEAQLKSGNHSVFIELNDAAQKSVNDLLQFVQQPAVNYDIFRMIEWVSQSFDKRVGLTELAYGLNPGGIQSRTASDIQAKQENMSIRPEYMAGKVESWQCEMANLEKFAARWHVTGKDVYPLLGRIGSQLWTSLITDEDPEVVVRDMNAMVEAGSVRRPNKQRDLANLQAIAGYVLPEMSKQADITGDTGPINSFFRSLGKNLDIETKEWEFAERTPNIPEPTPEQEQQQAQMMQAQQMQMQMEMQKQQLELEAKSLDVQAKQAEAAGQSADMQAEAARKQMELDFDVAQRQQDMQAQQMLAAMNAEKQSADAQADISKQSMDLQMEQLRRAQELKFAREKHLQSLVHSEETHDQSLAQKQDQADLSVKTAKRMGDVRVNVARKSAVKKPAKGK